MGKIQCLTQTREKCRDYHMIFQRRFPWGVASDKTAYLGMAKLPIWEWFLEKSCDFPIVRVDSVSHVRAFGLNDHSGVFYEVFSLCHVKLAAAWNQSFSAISDWSEKWLWLKNWIWLVSLENNSAVCMYSVLRKTFSLWPSHSQFSSLIAVHLVAWSLLA